jgi:hypothetical protein
MAGFQSMASCFQTKRFIPNIARKVLNHAGKVLNFAVQVLITEAKFPTLPPCFQSMAAKLRCREI